MGNLPIAISVEKFLNRPFPGTKLDVPRLAAPCGPARANRPGLSYRMSRCTIAARYVQDLIKTNEARDGRASARRASARSRVRGAVRDGA